MRRSSCCCFGLLAVLAGAPAAAISLGQTDDFQAGTVSGWSGGSSPHNAAMGGPAGDPDRYLAIDALNRNLGTYNAVQWAGDYLSAGVTAIRLDVRNTGPDPVALRLTVFGPNLVTAYTSVNAIPVAPGSGWIAIEFGISEADLVVKSGTASFADTLSSVSRLLIRHDPDPISSPAQQNSVTTTLGLDNVTAVPEPTTGLLVIAGLAALSRAPRACASPCARAAPRSRRARSRSPR